MKLLIILLLLPLSLATQEASDIKIYVTVSKFKKIKCGEISIPIDSSGVIVDTVRQKPL